MDALDDWQPASLVFFWVVPILSQCNFEQYLDAVKGLLRFQLGLPCSGVPVEDSHILHPVVHSGEKCYLFQCLVSGFHNTPDVLYEIEGQYTIMG